jgi:hypothetical protein
MKNAALEKRLPTARKRLRQRKGAQGRGGWLCSWLAGPGGTCPCDRPQQHGMEVHSPGGIAS